MGCVYLLTHIESGKRYVGQTTQHDTPGKRWARHQRDAKRGLDLPLHRAIRLYGAEGFTVENLYSGPNVLLNHLERFWAAELNSYIWNEPNEDGPGGYNCAWCGATPRMLGLKHTPAARQKIREANLRRWAKRRSHSSSEVSISEISNSSSQQEVAVGS